MTSSLAAISRVLLVGVLLCDGGGTTLSAEELRLRRWSWPCGQEVNRLGQCQCFGEAQLLLRALHTSTIKAIEPLRVRILTSEALGDLNILDRLHFDGFRHRRCRVHANVEESEQDAGWGGFTSSRNLKERPEDEVLALVIDALRNNSQLGSLVAHLSADSLEEMARSARSVRVPEGYEVVIEGSLKADLFYIIAEGSVEVSQRGALLCTLGAGQSFGEMALMFRQPRAATIRTTEETKLWTIHRTQLTKVSQASLRQKLKLYARMLDKIDLFSESSEEGREQAADALVETTFLSGEYVTPYCMIITVVILSVLTLGNCLSFSGEQGSNKDPGDGWDLSFEDTVGPRDLAAFPGSPGASGGPDKRPLKRKPSKPQVSKGIPEEKADVQPQEPQDAHCDLRHAFLALRSAADEGKGDSLDTASSCAEVTMIIAGVDEMMLAL